MTDSIKKLAREISGLKREVRSLSAAPQLAYSSIEDGSTDEYDGDGNLVGVFGKQTDDTHTAASFNGPIPPTPVTPIVAGHSSGVTISWSGEWEDDAVAPMDLARIDVVILTDPGDDPLPIRPSASIVSQGWGGASVNLSEGTYYAVLIAWTQSGKYAVSSVSDAAEVIVPQPSDGDPPDHSPDAEAVGVQGMILLRWDAVLNADPVTYEVHVSTTASFTPSASTLVSETSATMERVQTLHDGTRLSYDTDYYFQLIARDEDGTASPGAETSGQMDKLRQADLFADAIDGMTITGATIRTAESGQRVQMDINGLRTFNPANTETSKLAADSGGLALTGGLKISPGGTIYAGDDTDYVEIADTGLLAMTSEPIEVFAAATGVTLHSMGFSNKANGSFAITSGDYVNFFSLDGKLDYQILQSSSYMASPFVMNNQGVFGRVKTFQSDRLDVFSPDATFIRTIIFSADNSIESLSFDPVSNYAAASVAIDYATTNIYIFDLSTGSIKKTIVLSDLISDIAFNYNLDKVAITNIWPTKVEMYNLSGVKQSTVTFDEENYVPRGIVVEADGKYSAFTSTDDYGYSPAKVRRFSGTTLLVTKDLEDGVRGVGSAGGSKAMYIDDDNVAHIIDMDGGVSVNFDASQGTFEASSFRLKGRTKADIIRASAIKGLAAPVDDSDAANKAYVDDRVNQDTGWVNDTGPSSSYWDRSAQFIRVGRRVTMVFDMQRLISTLSKDTDVNISDFIPPGFRPDKQENVYTVETGGTYVSVRLIPRFDGTLSVVPRSGDWYANNWIRTEVSWTLDVNPDVA